MSGVFNQWFALSGDFLSWFNPVDDYGMVYAIVIVGTLAWSIVADMLDLA